MLQTFFGWCTRSDVVNQFRDTLESNIYACMEMSGQSYPDTVDMPTNRFQNYLRWKTKLEDDKKKALDEEIAKRL